MDFLSGWEANLLYGSFVTMEVAVFALIVGLVWGFLGAMAQLSHNRLVAALGRSFSLGLRATPELLVILIIYYGGTVTLTRMVNLVVQDYGFVEVPPLQAGVFALSLIFGGYAAEIIRGAWQNVPIGQIEAGLAFGLSKRILFFKIRLPSLLRYALPGLGNHWISLIKDTSLISIVGLHELMGFSKEAIAVTREPFKFYFVAAMIYLILTSLNGRAVLWLENRLRRGERRAAS